MQSFINQGNCESHQLTGVCHLAGGEIEQILQGVTEWVSGMLEDSSDPLGHMAAVQQDEELSSITTHVADVISQMVSSLAGPNQDMDVEITYEFDLAVSKLTQLHSLTSVAHRLLA